jgi:CheY-like chemotaxis protein
LAEDCDPIRVVTAAMLKGMGCDVESVVHGEFAVQSASENRFDVIVLDIEMPVMDGITAARSIRSRGGASAGAPLMALSAFLADSMRGGQWKETFDIALPKPANRNELHEAVRSALLWQQPSARIPPVIDTEALSRIRSGIAGSIWRELSAAACRDIEICLNQIERVQLDDADDAILTFADKLFLLGRTFAAPRLADAACKIRQSPPGSVCPHSLKHLLATGRATIQELHG